MTHTRMVKHLAERTRLPEPVVRMFLAVQRDVMRECFIRQEEIYFPDLMKLHAEPRKYRVPSNDAEMELREVEVITLRVRPMQSLKKEFQSWKNTES